MWKQIPGNWKEKFIQDVFIVLEILVTVTGDEVSSPDISGLWWFYNGNVESSQKRWEARDKFLGLQLFNDSGESSR